MLMEAVVELVAPSDALNLECKSSNRDLRLVNPPTIIKLQSRFGIQNNNYLAPNNYI
jgi:hypothetical protein